MMTSFEYDRIQASLSRLLDREVLRQKKLSPNREEGYKAGILACKSVLSCWFKPEE